MSIGLLVDMAFWAFKAVIRFFFFPLCTATGKMHKKRKRNPNQAPWPQISISSLTLFAVSLIQKKNEKGSFVCFLLFFLLIVNSMNICFIVSSELRAFLESFFF